MPSVDLEQLEAQIQQSQFSLTQLKETRMAMVALEREQRIYEDSKEAQRQGLQLAVTTQRDLSPVGVQGGFPTSSDRVDWQRSAPTLVNTALTEAVQPKEPLQAPPPPPTPHPLPERDQRFLEGVRGGSGGRRGPQLVHLFPRTKA